VIGKILLAIVALQHVAFAVLEMFLWNSPFGRKVFRTTERFAAETRALAANQGLYNLFLAAGLFASFLLDEMAAHWFRYFFLGCVVVAGAFGAATVNKRIFVVQAIPAVLAILFLVLGI
jgi:putative membrane protein